MPEEQNIGTRAVPEALLQQPVLARIATANPVTNQPHVVPVWFLWDGALQAVLFEGPVELITEPRLLVESMTTKIYTRYLGKNGVLAEDPQSWIHDPENLVIRLTPKKPITGKKPLTDQALLVGPIDTSPG